MQAPLEGVTVVEFGQAIAGPFASQLLADLGARVIKVERLTGDDSRGLPPYFVGDSSAYFMACNRSKESIALDLKKPEAVKAVLDLIANAQMVVENNRPGVMDRLGLGFEDAKRVNPSIVYCSVTGFGQDGPYRDLPAYDMIVQALSGGMSITGETGGRPVRSGMAIGDLVAAMMAGLTAVSALRKAEATGEAQHVDISMLDVQVSLLNYKFVYHLMFGVVPGPEGRDHSGIAEMGAFECSDGREVLISPLAENMWAGVCRAVERPELIEDLRFSTRPARFQNMSEVRRELSEAFAKNVPEYWIPRLQANGVPAANINTFDKVAADPQVQARGMIVGSHYGEHDLRLVGSPSKIVGVEPQYGPPPGLGEHSRKLLAEIGMNADHIDSLFAQGIVK